MGLATFPRYSTENRLPHLKYFARSHGGLWFEWNETWEVTEFLPNWATPTLRHLGIWVCVGRGSFLTFKTLLANPFLSTSLPLSSSLIIRLSPSPLLWTSPNFPCCWKCAVASRPPHRTSSKNKKQNPDLTHQSSFWVLTQKIWNQFSKKYLHSVFAAAQGRRGRLWKPLLSVADEEIVKENGIYAQGDTIHHFKRKKSYH